MAMRIVIIGGGPSGAFCAMGLLRAAGLSPGRPEVVILDKKIFSVCGPRGCNLCAGVISNSFVASLGTLGLSVPRDVVQREVRGYHFICVAGSLHLRKDPAATILTAYRALGPPDSAYSQERSFDHFLLQHATEMGAQHLRELVTDLTPPKGAGKWKVEYGDGKRLEADVVVVACGVHTPFLRKLADVGFGYQAPRTIHACQAEIPLEPAAVTERFQDEIKIFALGLPGIKFSAMVPKERHVTVTLVGQDVKRHHVEEFHLPPVRALFPRTWRLPDTFCSCHPKVPVSAASRPVADRLVVVGDAYVSRYLKNGLNSALQTGMLGARAILETGGDPDGLYTRYVRPCSNLFTVDNGIGRFLFNIHGHLERSPQMAHTLLRVHQAERALTRLFTGRADDDLERAWRVAGPTTRALWNMFTGDLPYMETMKSILLPWFGAPTMKRDQWDG
jgi:flavin-dependent dehydrogenase